MNRCPITYEACGKDKYSSKGLKLLSKNLNHLNDFAYTSKQQQQLALRYADKMSIQGMQPKLSVVFKPSKESFELVERNGTYIFKPPHDSYEEVPQNEDVTMKLASTIGIRTPIHGLIYNIDGTQTYFIKRFDRASKNQKIAVEDFGQLLGLSRDTKYESSMEKMIPVIDKHCTFPLKEKIYLFKMIIFNFLTGNEDVHIKNFSIIRKKNRVEFSPAYDLLNTTLVTTGKEEIALPLRGKKSNLKREDLINYFGLERLELSEKLISKEIQIFEKAIKKWPALIQNSFLSPSMQKRYIDLIQSRWNRLTDSSV